MNHFTSILDALKAAMETGYLNEYAILSDGEQEWDPYDLMDEDKICNELPLEGEDNYYCVGDDGSIGITHDGGKTIEWVYAAKF